MFIVFFVSSIIFDKKWKFGKSYISDLGISESPPARYFFNGGCIICGTLFVSSIIEFVIRDDLAILDYVVSALSIIMGVLFVAIGVINKEMRPHHRRIALSFFTVGFVLTVIMMLRDTYDARYVLAIVTMVGIAATVLSTKKLEWPATEVVGSLILLAIVSIHFFTIV